MNIFFELAECAVKDYGGKYFALYNISEGKIMTVSERYLFRNSERVWSEKDDGIRFMKHRYAHTDTAKVDKQEFFWIKLKCRTV